MGEIKAVLAVIINMGVIHFPEREGYWKTSWKVIFPFHDVLSRNRFEEMFWMLHLPEVTTPTHSIDKVKRFLHTLITTFQSVFYPPCEVSINETDWFQEQR